ncbi:DUF222 domain-containing protein [Pseudonocardia sp. CA-107938]|uniref:HNH endonuclease signature motif containing protein n=1 Tax=Pseudonocardia sp. CA-107938 TaxID=3240021 RepID=UPI003D8FA1F7
MFDVGSSAQADFDVPVPGWDDGDEWAPDGGPVVFPEVELSARPASSGLAMELEFGLPPLDQLDDATLLSVITSYARVAAWAQANGARALAEFARRRAAEPDDADYAADEIAVELRLATGTAQRLLDRATALDQHLAPTRALWEQGLLDERRVAVIVDGTGHLPVEIAARVQDMVLPRAPRQTVGQLRAAVQRAIIAADPGGAEARHRAAHAERAVQLWPDAEGMATLAAKLSAPDAVGCYEWLSRLARGLGADDPRPMDARRADLLVGLIMGRIVAGVAVPDESAAGESSSGESNSGESSSGEWDVAEPSAGQPASQGSAGGSTVGEPADGGAPVVGEPAVAQPDVSGSAAGPPAAQDPVVPGVGVREPVGAEAAAGSAFARASAAAGGSDGDAAIDGESVDVTSAAVQAIPDGESVVREPAGDATGGRPAARDPVADGAFVVEVVRPVAPGKSLVQVIVDLDTLRGATEHPAELAGYGPITAWQARAVASDAIWRRLVTDPLSGTVLDVGRTRYRPPAGLAELVRARDATCRFPGCRRAASGCELDHVIAYPEGPTADTNLAVGCPHHHHLKHDTDWRVELLPDGALEWTSPTGSTYRTYPRDYRPVDIGRPPPDSDPPPF